MGRLHYRWAWRLQHLRRRAVIAGRAPEAIWLLEHYSVVTTGRRVVEGLEGSGHEVVRTERGGLATWHGPGQLVGYLILDIRSRAGSVRALVSGIEQAVIDYLFTLGLVAARRDGYPGVWLGADKVCALGLHFSHGVSMHGFALNLRPDLDAWTGFVPCGIVDGGVTSVDRVLGHAPKPWDAASDVGAHLVDTLGLGG